MKKLVLSLTVFFLFVGSISLVLWLRSPYHLIYSFNKAWKQYDIRSIERYCDLQGVSSSLAHDLLYFSKEEDYQLSFLNKEKKASNTNQENIDLLIENILQDFFSKGDYFSSRSNADSLMKYFSDNKIIVTQKLPPRSVKIKNNEAVAEYPIWDTDKIEKATLYVQMNKKNGVWTITKIRNVKSLLDLLKKNKKSQFDLKINTSLDNMQEKPELFLIYWNNLLNKTNEYDSFAFRTKETDFLNSTLETTKYMLYEKTKENDIHFKCATDDSKGFSISIRDIYNIDDTIYYHGSAESGWIKVSEESATIETIQTPCEYLQSWMLEAPPNAIDIHAFSVNDLDINNINKNDGKIVKSKITKTRITCTWEDSKIE
ncbi:MAG: hypothetical protein KAH01_02295, partial [Caldisericia bacterium]|nr:hypothetical protein [Caldisericia bacterium]